MGRLLVCPEHRHRDRKSHYGRPCCTGDYIRNENGVAVMAPITSDSVERDKGDATWIVRRGLADHSCISFDSKNNPGDFLRQQNFALRVLPFDGTALNRSDATFC